MLHMHVSHVAIVIAWRSLLQKVHVPNACFLRIGCSFVIHRNPMNAFIAFSNVLLPRNSINHYHLHLHLNVFLRLNVFPYCYWNACTSIHCSVRNSSRSSCKCACIWLRVFSCSVLSCVTRTSQLWVHLLLRSPPPPPPHPAPRPLPSQLHRLPISITHVLPHTPILM